MGEGARLGVIQREAVGRADVVAEGEAGSARRDRALLDDDCFLLGFIKVHCTISPESTLMVAVRAPHHLWRGNAIGVTVNAGDVSQFIASSLGIAFGNLIGTRRNVIETLLLVIKKIIQTESTTAVDICVTKTNLRYTVG